MNIVKAMHHKYHKDPSNEMLYNEFNYRIVVYNELCIIPVFAKQSERSGAGLLHYAYSSLPWNLKIKDCKV